MVLYSKIVLDGNCCDCVPASDFSELCDDKALYASYSCTGSGDDCGSNQTHQADFDGFTPTTTADTCDNPTLQASYDANGSVGGGIGTFAINRVLTSSDPIDGSFAFLGCDPNGLYVSQVTYDDGAVQVKNYTAPTNSFGGNALHFWEATPQYSDSALYGTTILQVTVSWRTDLSPGGAPSGTYQLKGSFVP